jgi:glyoxylase-like metal-dependent hydrolase (beta-lactamase superfamily II)
VTSDVVAVQDLVERLEHGADVTVLDIRREDERADWFIPGSTPAPVYDDVRAGRLEAVDELAPALADQHVVVVCAAGITAAKAAARLRERGVDAATLEHGMRGWSNASQAVEVPVSGSGATVVQVARLGKGCLSYVVESGGEAVVIDPALDADVYERLAADRGWRIVAVCDTHVHADHLSRARSLAAAAGAAHVAPDGGRLHYSATEPSAAAPIVVGTSKLAVLAAPGHTPESVVYVLDDGAAAFTGDTLFTASVGRPDLEASAAQAQARAHSLYVSLHHLLRELRGDTVIAPCHASAAIEPGHAVWTRLSQARTIPLLALDEDAFVAQVTSALPPTPANHSRIVELNEAGELPDADEALDLEAGANRCAVTV